MNSKPIIRFLILSAALATASCTLISRPEPATTMLLTLPADKHSGDWPHGIAPGAVIAVTALQSNRVLVVNDAVLMQHEGLRWVDMPAVMLAEQLRMRHARNIPTVSASASGDATLDIWLTEFGLHIDASGGKSVVVAATAELVCRDSVMKQHLKPGMVTAPIASSDPQVIAKAFASATDQLLESVLASATEKQPACKR